MSSAAQPMQQGYDMASWRRCCSTRRTKKRSQENAMHVIALYTSWYLLLVHAFVHASDISEYFRGVSSRPNLAVSSPQDGVVLDVSTVHVQLQLDGYPLPPHFRDSSICIGLASDGEQVAESCFSQSSALDYTIEGLSPGSSYVLVAVLLERGNAIAVSVRSFRVGGVAIPYHLHSVQRTTSAQLTLQDALQMAVAQQAQGKHTQVLHLIPTNLTFRDGILCHLTSVPSSGGDIVRRNLARRSGAQRRFAFAWVGALPTGRCDESVGAHHEGI